jgi:vacuolar-type H+-ATPase subunit E/Vma4
MELVGQSNNYRQLAEEIGEVLQAAAETAERMIEDARADAARIRAEAEGDRRNAYAEGRRILDEARMEVDMMRAEAEWQGQEIIAQARRQAAERIAGIDTRLAELAEAEHRVMDRLSGAGQVLADALAALRQEASDTAASAAAASATATAPVVPDVPADDDPTDMAAAAPEDEVDSPSAKVYFVEFPPAAPADAAVAADDAEPEVEIVLPTSSDASLFQTDEERSEWAPPADMPIWWTRGGVQG